MPVLRNVLMDDKTLASIQKAAEENGISETLMCRRVLAYWGVVFEETRKLYVPKTGEEEVLMEQEELRQPRRGKGSWT